LAFTLASSNKASAYGAAGALIIVSVWVYYSAQILFLLLTAEFRGSVQRSAARAA
jgi:uncharacterized BrkB/YihY/UPF0761 family membrane protein